MKRSEGANIYVKFSIVFRNIFDMKNIEKFDKVKT